MSSAFSRLTKDNEACVKTRITLAVNGIDWDTSEEAKTDLANGASGKIIPVEGIGAGERCVIMQGSQQ